MSENDKKQLLAYLKKIDNQSISVEKVYEEIISLIEKSENE